MNFDEPGSHAYHSSAYQFFGNSSRRHLDVGKCDHELNENNSLAAANRRRNRPLDAQNWSILVAVLRKRCPNLSVIKLSNEEWQPHIESILTAYTERLECLFCPSYELNDEGMKLLKPSARLKHLAIASVRCSNFFELFPNVVRLTCNQLETSIIRKLPAGFESLTVVKGSPFEYLNAVSESAARSSIKEITAKQLLIHGRLSEVTFDCLESLTIQKYEEGDFLTILRVLSRSPLLKSICLPQKFDSKKDQSNEWIHLFQSATLIESLDVVINEISDEVFQVIATSLRHIKNLKLTLTGERVAATNAAFQSLTTILGLQSVDLFFHQEKEDVSLEVMLAFCEGPSNHTLEMIRIDRDDYCGDNEYYEKFDDCIPTMMQMVEQLRLQCGEIFGSHID